MGVVPNVNADSFPRQGRQLDTRVRVCFEYDTTTIILGTVVRDDAELPYEMIIRLDDGRYVLAGECQWQPAP